MTKLRRNIIIILGVLVVLLISGYIMLQNYVTSQIETYLESLPASVKVDYQYLNVDLIKGNVIINRPKVTYTGNTTGDVNALIELKDFQVSDVSVWSYINSGDIDISGITLEQPKITYYHNKNITKEQYQESSPKEFEKHVFLKQFEIKDASIEVFDRELDTLLVKAAHMDVQLNDIEVNASTLKQEIPVTYHDAVLNAHEVFYRMDDFNHIEVADLKITKDLSQLHDVHLYTKYSKKQLSKELKIEKDHFNLKIANLEVEDYDVGYVQDTVFYFKSPKISINEPTLKVFRDKLVADDLTIKKLYGPMIHDLPFQLSIDEVEVTGAEISYTEKVRVDNAGGTVGFQNLNAVVKNLSNTYEEPTKTTIEADGQFMQGSTVKVNWEFDVNDPTGAFTFHANVGPMKATDLNRFVEPNMHVRLNGQLLNTILTIYGNSYISNIDMLMKYDNLKVNLLKQNGQEKNKFLSGVVNIFVKKDSKDSGEDFKEGRREGVERDRTKSVFNFVWKNIESALMLILMNK